MERKHFNSSQILYKKTTFSLIEGGKVYNFKTKKNHSLDNWWFGDSRNFICMLSKIYNNFEFVDAK